MSKKSKPSAKRRTPSGKRNQVPPGAKRKSAQAASARLWGWVAGVAVVLLATGAVVWFTVGPGKPVSPTPSVVPVATESTAPTESTEKESPMMPENPADRNGMYTAPPAMQIDPGKTYVATIETEKGDIVLELAADKAPNTVNNFVFLARQGFYDNTTFHRVIAGFMAQGGDPTGMGSGGPGYSFPDEFHPDLRHDGPGIISMANSGANTNGSQFFITYAETAYLDAYDANDNPKDCARPDVSCHAVFGRVTEGMDVLESISPRDPMQATGPGDLIKTVRIEER